VRHDRLPGDHFARILVLGAAVIKLVFGLLKGAVVGAVLGYGAYRVGLTGAMYWITYGVIGALVGLVAGRPLWALITDKNGTSWVSILKALFGFGVGCGLYALVSKAWGGFSLSLSFLEPEARMIQHWQPVFGAAIGGFLGAFFEIDDAIGGDAPAGGPKAGSGKKPAPTRKPAARA
jgi:hypothetical protein